MTTRHNREFQNEIVPYRGMSFFIDEDCECGATVGFENLLIVIRKFIDVHTMTKSTIPLLINIFDEYNKILFHKVNGENKSRIDADIVMERIGPVFEVMEEDMREHEKRKENAERYKKKTEENRKKALKKT